MSRGRGNWFYEHGAALLIPAVVAEKSQAVLADGFINYDDP